MFTKEEVFVFMNKKEFDIVNALLKEPFTTQRKLAELCGHSLGIVNKALKSLQNNGYINEQMNLTQKALQEIEENKPKRAIILAAGFGMRMVPINLEIPKALIEVKGEILIERMIRQLHKAGIFDITVVVGFMKEKFEYLIDDFHVELIVNSDYATKNNLYSLNLVLDKLENTYIIPSDIWCKTNPFSKVEPYSWYMISDMIVPDSMVRINRKEELVRVGNEDSGNQMIGISYLTKKDCDLLKSKISDLCKEKKNDDLFWEEALFQNNKMILNTKVVRSSDVTEINTYEELRELDENSNQLKSNAIEIIKESLHIEEYNISNITVLKKGMTNRSFLFNARNRTYIMRIPGEGTDELINRQEEAAVYDLIKNRNICDNIIYINPENGYKITEYIPNARVCDAFNPKDLNACMKRLREFHSLNLQVSHSFDIFEKINFYESLWNGNESVYRDYKQTKTNVFSLKKYIESQVKNVCLTHIDAIPDNFLFTVDGEIRIIDWEYAAMQDPHVDIATFCIYALYNKEEVDRLIDIYFEGNCDLATRIKIYAYISCCGLLWSNWCEYKSHLGIEFGEYSLKQYRYAKDYYRLSKKLLED